MVRALAEAVKARDIKALAQCVAEDTVWFDIQGEQTRPVAKGREAVQGTFETRFRSLPSGTLERHMLATNGAFVSVRERTTWKDPQGRQGSGNVFALYEVVQGRIQRAWHFLAP